MSKVKDFIHKVANDLGRVHVRAAFIDVEHRIAHLFHHHGEHLPASTQAAENEPAAEDGTKPATEE